MIYTDGYGSWYQIKTQQKAFRREGFLFATFVPRRA